MPFFKEFRRKKTSSKIDEFPISSNDSNGSNGTSGTNGTVPTTKSSSTINSVYASSTPPSSIQPQQSTPTLVTSKSTGAMTPLPQRPMPLSSVSNRSSFMVRMHPFRRPCSCKNQHKHVSSPVLTCPLHRDRILHPSMEPRHPRCQLPASLPEYCQFLQPHG